jgi:hypothetical protein
MKPISVKRAEAEQRSKAWQALTPQQQLAYLDRHSLVAIRQRKKIAEAIKSVKAAKR